MTNMTDEEKRDFVEGSNRSLEFIEKLKSLLIDAENDILAHQKDISDGSITTTGLMGVILTKELAAGLPEIMKKAEKQYAYIVKKSMQ